MSLSIWEAFDPETETVICPKYDIRLELGSNDCLACSHYEYIEEDQDFHVDCHYYNDRFGLTQDLLFDSMERS